MLFEERLRAGLADGSVTVALRRWRRPQVTLGGVYRTGGDGPRVAVRALDVVRPQDLTPDDARAAGHPDVAALLGSLRGEKSLPLYRVRFEVVAGDDPREALARDDVLSDDDVDALRRRLARIDAAGPDGPWTATVLGVVGRRPAVVSTELAAELGLDRSLFKRRVRTLKELGLTTSLEVGYRLSPRGAAVLARLDEGGRDGERRADDAVGPARPDGGVRRRSRRGP